MKMPTLRMVQVLCLIGFFAGPLQALNVINMPLDMFENSVDDQYINCNFEVPKIPVPKKYKEIWQEAKNHWDKTCHSITNVTQMQAIAIMAYTHNGTLYRDFNEATRKAGESQETYDKFAFKNFFFLLTKGVQARKKNNKCYEVFRGIQGIRFKVSKEQEVRFGQFASSSLSEQGAKGFGQNTLFSIRTCYGVPIGDISFFKGEEEVLIPPYETFKVMSEENVSPIRLESTRVRSRFNCGRLRGKRPKVQVAKLQRGGRSFSGVSFPTGTPWGL